jgi:uncharacterized protein with PIN domain
MNKIKENLKTLMPNGRLLINNLLDARSLLYLHGYINNVEYNQIEKRINKVMNSQSIVLVMNNLCAQAATKICPKCKSKLELFENTNPVITPEITAYCHTCNKAIWTMRNVTLANLVNAVEGKNNEQNKG